MCDGDRNPEMFATEGEVIHGTTDVDFTAWLWGALNEIRSSRETWLRVGAQGFELKTKGAGGRFEQKVELPDSWVRGFPQVSEAMAMPGTRITVKPADLLAAIRYLRYTKAKVSPRALPTLGPNGGSARANHRTSARFPLATWSGQRCVPWLSSGHRRLRLSRRDSVGRS